ncbi:MAG: polysaccharide biosynthesis protein VpsM [Thiomicrorhabdus sp.]|nr:MAG: polysaccharide biosynthesis protein VpsM [Thiomicrorhabdus sp.]
MKIQNKIKLAVLLASASGSVFALDPNPIDVNGMYFVPTIEVTEAFDDNLRASNVAVEGWVTAIKPNFVLGFEGNKGLYELSYALDHQLNHATNVTNLTNQSINATAEMEFDVRNALDLSLSYTKTQSIDAINVVGGSSMQNMANLNGLYVYGADTASFNVELGFNAVQMRSDDGLNLDLERDTNAVDLAFVYRVSPKTRLVAEAKSSQNDYTSNDALDSTNTAMLVGARWDATAKTTGRAKIGKETKDFDAVGTNSATLSNWEVSIDWTPLSYSVITFNTKQMIEEGSLGANSVNNRTSGVAWQHAWASGIGSQLSLSSTSKEYSSTRTDTLNSASVGLKYAVERWMDVGLDYQYSDQDSDTLAQKFTRNKIIFSVNLSL